jgi:hypothetical protein
MTDYPICSSCDVLTMVNTKKEGVEGICDVMQYTGCLDTKIVV